ncbi:phytanoyl-CoA dioxygenase family protein [Anthocerotibacter panamensis]|uniref:phytanoyl-CoA dioxygenase family protein n=1 Tax=Anthocerotibacter panamensis TaxID=2857077 RepID=UPI001C40511E|nr:phytanoyl-CoA dioxygenase family protein [Anthocerotibacter panamensis]
MDNLKATFAQQGYLSFRQVFCPQEITLLLAGIDRARSRLHQLSRGRMFFYDNLFQKNDDLQAFISQPKILDLLTPIAGPDLFVRWDQLVVKEPGGVEFPWHQDNSYNDLIEPHFQLWIALTPMTPENGGLWVQPGSHRSGLLPHIQVDKHMVCTTQPGTPVFIQAEPGDVVLFSSYLLHHTAPNRTQQSRWAYVVEYMSQDQLDPYLRAPYFIASRQGLPAPQFTHFYRGRLKLRNHVNYLVPRMQRVLRRTKKLWHRFVHL